MDAINERTRFSLLVTFLDYRQTRSPPATARWRAYCETTGTNLTEWADLTVSSATAEVEIEVPAEVTQIQNDRNRREIKVIAVESDYGTAQQVSTEYKIAAKNLRVTA